MLSNCKIIFKDKEYTLDEFKQFVLENGMGSLLGDSPSQPISEEVGQIFNGNEDLKKIGSAKEYAIYLETIFPKSKLKDVVYHGSKSLERFDNFNVAHIGTGTTAKIDQRLGDGFYFTTLKSVALDAASGAA